MHVKILRQDDRGQVGIPSAVRILMAGQRDTLAHPREACHSVGMTRLFSVSCGQPWLVATFPASQRMLSWSINRPGFVDAHRVAWLEVRNAELPLGVDPAMLLAERLGSAALTDAVGMMTARDIRRHRLADAQDGGVTATVLATVGLTNGVRFDRNGAVTEATRPAPAGTINMLAAVSCRLDDAALVEAVSIVATARTAALLADRGRVAATGTDCIVVACAGTGSAVPHAGLHTPVGRSLAAAAFAATRDARADWEHEFAHAPS